MINITQDIHSLTEFKKRTSDFIHNLKETGRPAILTVNGKAEIIVMDANIYQKMQEQLAFQETLQEINDSLKDFELGKSRPHKEVLDELRQIINQEAK